MRRYPPHNTHPQTWFSRLNTSHDTPLSSLRHALTQLLTISNPPPPCPTSQFDDVHVEQRLAALHTWLNLSSPLTSAQRRALVMLMKPHANIIRTAREPTECRVCGRRLAPEKEGRGAWATFWAWLSVLPFWLLYVPLFFWRLFGNIRTRFARAAVLKRKTAALQRVLANAPCYSAWYSAASNLDHLEGRDHWATDPRYLGFLTPLCTTCSDTWNTKRRVRARKKEAVRANLSVDHVCDVDMIARKMNDLAALYNRGDVRGLAFALRGTMVRNLGGMCHPTLHAHSRVAGNQIVEHYVDVISFLLAYVAHSEELPAPVISPVSSGEDDTTNAQQRNRPDLSNKLLSMEDKLTFLNEARHAFGRTALMLSGGAAMGLNHLGVVKALLDQQLLPKVVCGTSAGALVASIVAIFDDEQLADILSTEYLIHPLTKIPFSFEYFDNQTSLWRRLWRLIRQGFLHDVKKLQQCLRDNYGDVTFEEAYNKTRRILNITVCPVRSSSDPPLLLNYLTAPHVVIWSAASASCALPLVFAPVELVAKNASGQLVPYHPDGIRWIDGSISSDIPLSRIGELFNVNHFIVSQTNPHVIPRSLPILQTRLALLIKSELQFRYWQLLQIGLVPRLLTSIFPHFMQPYAGDVTIMPDVRLADLLNLLRNPTPESIMGTLRRGEIQTFPFLDRIRLHCLIEQTLDTSVECVATMAQASIRSDNQTVTPSSSAQGNSLFGRVPSWLWLDTRSMLSTTPTSTSTQRLATIRNSRQQTENESKNAKRTDRMPQLASRAEADRTREQVTDSNPPTRAKEGIAEPQAFADLDDILDELAQEPTSPSLSPQTSRDQLPELSDSDDSEEEDRVVC